MARTPGEPDPGGGPWPVIVPPALTPADAHASPSFSVVVATYQAASTISAALQSALAQTYPPLEVVVCDDGSTDDTSTVLAGFGSAIRTIRQTNRGEAAAKNAAVAAARGDYVVVLDADDVFLPRRLEALAWLAQERPDLDVLTTDALLEANGVVLRRAYHAEWEFPANDQRKAILNNNFVFGLCAVRRERWLAAGGFQEQLKFTADWEFWQRLVLSGSLVGLVDVPLALYRLSAGTLSADHSRLVQARLTVLALASARNDLTPRERQVVASAMRRERRSLRRLLAEAVLPAGGWVARYRFACVLLGRGVGTRARMSALLAVMSPGLAAYRRSKRVGGTVEVGAGLRVSHDPAGTTLGVPTQQSVSSAIKDERG